MSGVQPLILKTKQAYRIAFSFRGVQCRERIALPHTKANETYCQRLRSEILGKIERGQFVYSEYFPDSPRAAIFGHGPGRAKLLLKSRLEAYRDNTKKTLEPSTWKCYARDINNVLIPWCGDKDVRALTKADIKEFVRLQTVKLKRIQNLLLPLRNVMSDAADDDIIKVNPFDGLKLKKLVSPDQRESDYEANPYTTDELVKVLANLRGLERWTFQLWAFTGLRTGELVGLRWRRIDLEGNTLRVVETTTVGEDKARPKTPAGVRTIPLLPAALEAVQGMRAFTQLAGDRFTVNPRGRREDPFWDTNKLAEVWAKAHRKTGVTPRHPYTLRHTFASQLLSQGENLAYIANLLGHKDVEMVTRTYGKWVEEGEKLGFDRPPRRYGMAPLWSGLNEKEAV